jgi:hypothetical protein
MKNQMDVCGTVMVCHGSCHGNSSFIEGIAFYFFV